MLADEAASQLAGSGHKVFKNAAFKDREVTYIGPSGPFYG